MLRWLAAEWFYVSASGRGTLGSARHYQNHSGAIKTIAAPAAILRSHTIPASAYRHRPGYQPFPKKFVRRRQLSQEHANYRKNVDYAGSSVAAMINGDS
jgi:hypothetical protein